MGDTLRKILVIARREYLERVRSRWFVIATLFGPLLFAAFGFIPVMLAVRGQQTAPRLIVLDATATGLGRYTALALGAPQDNGSGNSGTVADLRLVVPGALPEAERLATTEVRDRLASGYVVLDSAVLTGGPVRYAGRRADTRSEQVRIADAVRAARATLRAAHGGLPAPALDSMAATPTPALSTVAINDAGVGGGNPAKQVLAAFVAFLLYASIIFYGQSMMSSVIEEKLSRVAEIVVSSVRPQLLLAGKVLGITAVGITQMALWIGGTVLIVSMRSTLFGGAAKAAPGAPGGMAGSDFLTAILATPWSWVFLVLLFFVLGFIFFAALYAAVGSTVGSESEARQAAQPVVLLLVFTAIFISPVANDPASSLSRWLSLVPFSSPILMPLRMALYDVPAWEIAASIVFLVIGVLAALWLAARIYRVGLLMYGKRPSFGELRRWIVAR